MALRASSIERYKAFFPATKPELAQRLSVTPGRAQQIVTELLKHKIVKPHGVVLNGAGGLVQRFVPNDHNEDNPVGLLDIPQDKKGQTP